MKCREGGIGRHGVVSEQEKGRSHSNEEEGEESIATHMQFS
jgi:hypothetical protein